MELQQAVKTLEQKGLSEEFEYALDLLHMSKETVDQCLIFNFPDADSIKIMYDNSWRQGQVCLVLKDGKIEKLLWHYDWMQP